MGIIARLFAFCNRVSEQIFVSGVSCRYLPTSQLQIVKIFFGNRLRTEIRKAHTKRFESRVFSPSSPFSAKKSAKPKTAKTLVNRAFPRFSTPLSAFLPKRKLTQECLKSTYDYPRLPSQHVTRNHSVFNTFRGFESKEKPPYQSTLL